MPLVIFVEPLNHCFKPFLERALLVKNSSKFLQVTGIKKHAAYRFSIFAKFSQDESKNKRFSYRKSDGI